MLLICICIIPNKVNAQNYSIGETITYINNLLVDNNIDNKITYSNQNLSSVHIHGDEKQYYTKQTIDINDISDVTITDGNISVKINCLNNKGCSTNTLGSRTNTFEEATNGSTYFYIETDNYDIAKKISNALRYIIEKGKKEPVKSDPFSSYSGNKNYNTNTNIYDLKIGMSKDDVFKKFKTKPAIESIEKGYKVYKIKEGEQYFLYFVNEKLTRIDRGVRSPDTIIKIQ